MRHFCILTFYVKYLFTISTHTPLDVSAREWVPTYQDKVIPSHKVRLFQNKVNKFKMLDNILTYLNFLFSQIELKSFLFPKNLMKEKQT